MAFHLNFDDITNIHVGLVSSFSEYDAALTESHEAIQAIIDLDDFQGSGANAAKTYFSEVHYTLMNMLSLLLAEYDSRFIVYKDTFDGLDGNNHAVLPEENMTDAVTEFTTITRDFSILSSAVSREANSIADLISASAPATSNVDSSLSTITEKTKGLIEDINEFETNHSKA